MPTYCLNGAYLLSMPFPESYIISTFLFLVLTAGLKHLPIIDRLLPICAYQHPGLVPFLCHFLEESEKSRADSGPDSFDSRAESFKTLENAEREGFELSVGLPLHLISSQAPSAARPPLRLGFY